MPVAENFQDFGPKTLAVTETVDYDTRNSGAINLIVTVANIGSNVSVKLQGTINGTDFVDLPGTSWTYGANGNYLIQANSPFPTTRFNFVSRLGGTPAVTVRGTGRTTAGYYVPDRTIKFAPVPVTVAVLEDSAESLIAETHNIPPGINGLTAQGSFTYGSGGTSAKFYLQTTIDGENWRDVCCFAYTTASSSLAVNLIAATALQTAQNFNPPGGVLAGVDTDFGDNSGASGLIGNSLRVKQIITASPAYENTIFNLAIRMFS